MVKPINIWFPQSSVQRMLALMELSHLPSEPPIPGKGWELGIDLGWLKDRKSQFESELEGNGWSQVEQELNRFHHYTVEIEGIDIHFIHEPSDDKDAVPIILLHGWPGSFYDYFKIIEPLSKPPTIGLPSFHVVVPSLPGFGLSSYPPRDGWSIVDTARVMHKLMHDVLGYKKYAGQGGDWGAYILRVLGTTHPDQAALLHMNMFRCPPTGVAAYLPYLSYLPLPSTVTAGIESFILSRILSPLEHYLLKRRTMFMTEGQGYSDIQRTKPHTIGYAIGSSPLALLAYIGEKMHAWSDPMTFDPRAVIITTAIYWLTESFPTSVMIYNQSRVFRHEMTVMPGKWKVRSKMGFTAFPFEIGAAPRAWIAECGNLVFYRERSKGGHFPALDNPEDLVTDVRDLVVGHW